VTVKQGEFFLLLTLPSTRLYSAYRYLEALLNTEGALLRVLFFTGQAVNETTMSSQGLAQPWASLLAKYASAAPLLVCMTAAAAAGIEAQGLATAFQPSSMAAWLQLQMQVPVAQLRVMQF
jgi:sulfur relay (sulfurtransferase) complex TusBCD TusD component (DsrE family)